MYYNIADLDSYSSVEKLFKRCKLENKNISKNFIQNWLKNQDIYTLHKYFKKNRNRSSFISSEIDRFWMTDLMDLSKYSRLNAGNKYILVVIDVLSKYLWLEILKNKKPQSIKDAFTKIFKKGRICQVLISDAGTEFNNKIFQQFLLSLNIKHYIMRNTEIKASVAERVIRTIKEKIEKIIFSNKDKKYYNFLHEIASNYNNSTHSRTKFKPINVNEKNKWEVFLNLFSKRVKNEPIKFKINDKVRILRLKRKFEKGYTNSWSEEIFKVSKVIKTLPYPRYRIKDLNNQELIGSFYSFELQKI